METSCKVGKLVELIIFDMDGTLIDSMYLWREVDKEFLQKRGFSVPVDYPAH